MCRLWLEFMWVFFVIWGGKSLINRIVYILRGIEDFYDRTFTDVTCNCPKNATYGLKTKEIIVKRFRFLWFDFKGKGSSPRNLLHHIITWGRQNRFCHYKFPNFVKESHTWQKWNPELKFFRQFQIRWNLKFKFFHVIAC